MHTATTLYTTHPRWDAAAWRVAAREELRRGGDGGALAVLRPLGDPYLLLGGFAFALAGGLEGFDPARAREIAAVALPWGWLSAATLGAAGATPRAGSLRRSAGIAPALGVLAPAGLALPGLLIGVAALAGLLGGHAPGVALAVSLLVAYGVVGALAAALAAGQIPAARLALPGLLRLGFFVSPVLYSIDALPPAWRWAAWLNPLAPLLTALREALGQGRFPDVPTLGLAAAWWMIVAPVVLLAWAAGRDAVGRAG